MKKSYIKGFLEDIVIHLIGELGESYGYELTRLVEERTKGIITINEGALYPVLHKLESNGVLISEMKTNGNRSRKYYRLSQASKERGDTQADSVKDYLNALNAIFSPSKAQS